MATTGSRTSTSHSASFAIEAAHGDRDKALQYLRPAGKGLADIFRGQIDDAMRKQADPSLFHRYCAGLISLPRPIPIEALAASVGVSLSWSPRIGQSVKLGSI